MKRTKVDDFGGRASAVHKLIKDKRLKRASLEALLSLTITNVFEGDIYRIEKIINKFD